MFARFRTRARSLGLLALLLLSTSTVRAQDASTAPPSASPQITPPKPAGPIEVQYPADAVGESVVLLHLLVEVDGRVSEAVAVEGEEPFATVARQAALSWRFEPATRDGKPLAARIRFQVRFVPPPPPPPEEPAAPPSAASTAPPGRDVPKTPAPTPPPQPPHRTPVTVFVHGEKPPPSARSFTRAEVRQLPGAFGDPFRAIEALPGVTPMVSGVPFFFVRGAPPGNVGYYLDGIRVPLLYHVALGPSVIHPAIVARVDLHAGGYPAQFGRYTGGIVAAETKPPALELHGEASVRLIDAGLLLEDAWSNGQTSATVGGRYSYTAAALSLLSPEVVLQYWDYQLRAARRVNETDTVGVFSFGAFDYLGEKQDGETDTVFGTQFHRLDLRYDHEPSDDEQLRAAVTVGLDRTDASEDEGAFLRDRMVGARLEWKARKRDGLWVRAGADVLMDQYDVVPPERDEEDPEDREQFGRLFPTRTDLTTGAYVSAAILVAPRVTVTPGIRTDLYNSDGATALGVDPRVSAEFEVSERVRLEHTLGIVHQPPSFAIPIPGFQIGGLRGGLQRAVQTSAGVHVELPEDVKASVTLFQNVFFNMTDAIGVARAELGDDEDELELRSLGHSFGLEVYLRRRLTRRFGGFVSYTLSRSTRSFGRVHVPSSFDRTHVLNVAAAYDLGRQWRAGSRLTYYSGFPGDLTTEAWLAGREAERSPGFFRGDIRFEKRWRINEEGAWWAFVIEVLNATLQKEVVDYECGLHSCTAEEIGPVTIPSIGVEAAF
jgi:TonB dependent receptor-like, beta-barrel/TonB-dependent Receptor Plug Domain/Gram-negative bacterial TonB protein C-terminal